MTRAEGFTRGSFKLWLKLFAAIALLNIGLTFDNVWPTPLVKPQWQLSVEVAVLLLGVAGWTRWSRVLSKRQLGFLALTFTLLVMTHYLVVTTAGLYGRSISLYWDARHIPRVGLMIVEATPGWRLITLGAGIVLLLAVVFFCSLWAISILGDAVSSRTIRRVVGGVGLAATVLFVIANFAQLSVMSWFSPSVTMSYARQAKLLSEAVSGSSHRFLATNSALEPSNLERLAGADVCIIFLESYGATSFVHRPYDAALTKSRLSFGKALTASNRQVVSAFVDSPTFAGVSWLAHASLLSGLDIRDNRRYHTLLGSKRETLVARFAASGYRAVALMPGLKLAWPEGQFYGYAQIYDGAALDYDGPDFGWWRIPDQYSLARIPRRELSSSSRAPVFLVAATINTHLPFRPTPPFQPNWGQILTGNPFSPEQTSASLARPVDWADIGGGYVDSLAYTMTYLASYLEEKAPGNVVMVLIGDHQPATIVSGKAAGFAVPVHVISDRRDILEALTSGGFQPGLTPRQPSLGPMHELTAVLMRAFSEP